MPSSALAKRHLVDMFEIPADFFLIINHPNHDRRLITPVFEVKYMPGTKMVDKSQNENGSSSSGASRGSSSDISRGSSTESPRGMTGSSTSHKKSEAGKKSGEAEHECCGHSCTDHSHKKDSD
jgi:hypothetical protein